MNYSRWATNDEIKNKLTQVSFDTDVERSGIPMMYDDNNLYIKDDEVHSIIVGAIGSGKTQTIILPTLKLAIKAGESFILHDVKGEIYNQLSGELNKRNYNIVVINLDDTTKGNSFNPLTLPYELYKKGNKDKAIDLLENIAYYFCCNEKVNTNSDPFWINSACSLFTGLALYIFENAEEDEININSIVNLTSSIDKISEYVNTLDKSSPIYMYLSSITQAPTETAGSIIAVFRQKIKLFTTRENLSKLLSKSDFNILNIKSEKTALFIISNNNLSSRSLIPLIIDECYHAAMIASNKNRLNILIDEFENLVPIYDFINMLTLGRSNNIKINIYVKSFLELINTYGKESFEMLKLAFGNIIYLMANDYETLEEISKLCGNINENNKLIPLISADQLKLLNNFEAVILMPRMYPIKTKLLPDFKINWNFSDEIVDLKELKIDSVKVKDI